MRLGNVELVSKILIFTGNNIALLSVTVTIFPLIIMALITPVPNIWADNDNGNDDPNPRQLSDLRTCTIQEENIQGRTIIGTILADVCRGTQHSETILGLQDNDVLSGEGGDDIVLGGEGDDKIFGNAGDDLLQGNLEDDKIDGGGRNDVLIGGDGDDILSGEDGDDRLFGDVGNDILRGGAGANEFICGDGVDTVLDYNPAKGDVISNDCEIVNTPG
jgi:Ca2+-binding RTX toxin-like protein